MAMAGQIDIRPLSQFSLLEMARLTNPPDSTSEYLALFHTTPSLFGSFSR